MARAATAMKWARSCQLGIGLVGQAQVNLVDQRRGLEGVIGALAAHVMMREPAQIFVDQRREFGESGVISLAPITQELPNSLWRGGLHISALSPIAVELAISLCTPGSVEKFSGRFLGSG